MEYPWIVEAKKHLGLEENKNAAEIKEWVKYLGLGWFTATFRASTIAWCGVYVAYCLKRSGFDIVKNWFRALEWNNYGTGLVNPTVGCIATLTREGGGHVFFVLGVTDKGEIVGIGGNQGNKVSIAKFDKTRISAYRWPSGYPLPEVFEMPKLAIVGGLSTNEA